MGFSSRTVCLCNARTCIGESLFQPTAPAPALIQGGEAFKGVLLCSFAAPDYYFFWTLKEVLHHLQFSVILTDLMLDLAVHSQAVKPTFSSDWLPS